MSLRHRINDDRTNRADRVTLAEKIETDNSAVASFGHHSDDRRCRIKPVALAICWNSMATIYGKNRFRNVRRLYGKS